MGNTKVDDSQNEPALVCAAREGDKEALQQLLTRHWSWLKALAYGVLGRAQGLDDVMQDVCLRAITRIHTLREPECFRAWLAVLTRREALKYCQQKGRRPVEIEMDFEILESMAQVEGPLESLMQAEQCARVFDAAEALPQIYREVFMLAHSGELTYAQMAEVLDVPMTTMQIRLVRARRMVQQKVIGSSEHKVYER